MKKNKWVLLLIAFVAFLVLVYFIGACLNATAEALTIISLCIGILVIYLVVKAIKSKQGKENVIMSNSYYTHCYHDILYSYDSGGHLMDTTKSYHQAVGG